MCHAAEPLWEGVEVPPKGVVLETPGQIRAHARAIGMQAVHTHAMPPGNVTFLEEGEPQLLATSIAAGATAWSGSTPGPAANAPPPPSLGHAPVGGRSVQYVSI